MTDFNRENFPYVKYLEEVQGVTDIGDLTDDQKQQTYDIAANDYLKEVKKDPAYKDKDKAIGAVIDRFGEDARSTFNVPSPVEDPDRFMSMDSALEYAESINKGGVLDGKKLSDVVDDYADQFVKGSDAYHRFPQFREGDGISSKDYKNKIKKDILGDNLDNDSSITFGQYKSEKQDAVDVKELREKEVANEEPGVLDRLSDAFDASVEDVSNVTQAAVASIIDLAGKGLEGSAELGQIIGEKTGAIPTNASFGTSQSGTITVTNQSGSTTEIPLRRFHLAAKDGNGKNAVIEVSSEELFRNLRDEKSRESAKLIGNSLQDLSKGINEGLDQQSIAVKTGTVVGQLAGFVGSGAIGGPLFAGGLAVASGAEFQSDDYEATITKRGEEIDPEVAKSVRTWGAMIGSLESLPAMAALKRAAGLTDTSTVLKWLDETSGGTLRRVVLGGAKGSVQEAGQEVLSQTLTNLGASNVLKYDEDRETFEGAEEAGKTGAAAGGTINAFLGYIGGHKAAQRAAQADTESTGTSETTITTNDVSQPDGQIEPTIDGEQEAFTTPVESETITTTNAPPVGPEGQIEPTIDGEQEAFTVQPTQPVEPETITTTKGTPFKTKGSATNKLNKLVKDGTPKEQLETIEVDGGYVVTNTPPAESETLVQSPTDTIVKETPDGEFLASREGEAVGRAPTADEAANAVTPTVEKGEEITIGTSIGSSETTVKVEATGKEAKLLDSKNKPLVTVVGPDAQSTIEQLSSKHADNTPFRLLAGTKIENRRDGSFDVSIDSVVKINTQQIDVKAMQDLRKAYIKRKETPAIELFQFEQNPTPVKIEVTQPKGRSQTNLSGFRPPRFKNKKTLVEQLEGNGFKVDTATDLNVLATKDGLSYEISVGKSTRNPLTGEAVGNSDKEISANVVVRDAKGSVVDGSANTILTDVKGSLVNNSFDLVTPRVGFTITRPQAGGQSLSPKFDVGNVQAVANRTDGTVEVAQPNFVRVTYNGGADTLQLEVRDDNKVFATVNNGPPVEQVGDFFGVKPSGDQASLITDQLAKRGYTKVNNHYENERGDIVTLDNQVATKNGNEISTSSLIDSDTPDVSEPFQPTIQSVVQRTDESFEKVSNQTLTNEDSPNVVFDTVDDYETRELLYSIEANPTMDVEGNETGDLSQKDSLSSTDLQQLVESVFDPKVSRTIEFHDTPNPAVFQPGVLGFFAPNTDRAGKFIHINNSGRTANQVLDTISEEISHFGFDTFTDPRLQKLYDKMYISVKNEIVNSPNLYDNYIAPQYKRDATGEFVRDPSGNLIISREGIDVNNPTPAETHMMVNEYFSKLGVSFIDFTSNKVLLPEGMTRDEFNAIKKDVNDSGVKDMVIDLTKDAPPHLKDEAKALIEQVIRLQTSAVRSKGFQVTYKTDTGDLVIRPTPYGKSTEFIQKDRTNQVRISNRKHLSRRTGPYSAENMSWVKWQAKKAVAYLEIRNTPIGRENTMLLSESESHEARSTADALISISRKNKRMRKILRDHGVEQLKSSDSYVRALNKVGVTDKKSIKLAKELDTFLIEATNLKYKNTASIHDEFRSAKGILAKWVLNDETGVLKGVAAEYNHKLSKQQQLYNSEWAHRRYDAFTKEGLLRLQAMQSEIRGPVNRQELRDKASAAQVKIDAFEKLTDSGKKLGKKENNQLAEARADVELFNRLTSLYDLVTSTKRGERAQEKIHAEMLQHVGSAIRRNKDAQGIGSSAFQNIDANQKKVLDLEGNDADRLYGEFLGELVDPVDALVHDIEQQGQILSGVKTNNKLAVELVNDGVALPEVLLTNGLAGNFEAVGKNKNVLAGRQGGTLLEFLVVDDVFAEGIADQMSLYEGVQANALNTFLGEVKRNLTVRSGFGITSSYVGNISMMLASGHALSFKNVREGAPEIKNAWLARNKPAVDQSSKDYYSNIVKTMSEYNLLGSGLSTATVDVTNVNGVKKIFDKVNTLVTNEKANQRVEVTSQFIQDVDDALAKTFAFSDDFPKVIPFMVNRQLGMSEAALQLNRNDFSSMKEYNKAMESFANKFAAERTRRETVSWELAPQFVRRFNAGKDANVRLAVADFVGHMVQMTRTLAENHVMIGQDYKRAFELRKQGETGLAKEYFIAASRRAVGTTINDGVWASSAIFGNSVAASLMKMAADAVGWEDEPDTPMSQKKAYSENEWDAALVLSRIHSKLTKQTFEPVPFRDGTKMTFSNTSRSNATLSFNGAGPVSPEVGTKMKDYLMGGVNKFVNTESPTLVIGLVNKVLLGNTQYGGGKLTDEQRAGELAKLLTPQLGHQVYQAVTGERAFSKNRVNQGHVIASTLGGVKVVEATAERIINNYGMVLARKINVNQNTTKKSLMNKLLSGDNVEINTIETMVEGFRETTNDDFREASFAFNSMKKLGFEESQISNLLSKDPNGVERKGLGVKQAKALGNEVNIFDESTLKSLRKELNELKKEKPTTDRRTQENIDANIRNLKIAIGFYK